MNSTVFSVSKNTNQKAKNLIKFVNYLATHIKHPFISSLTVHNKLKIDKNGGCANTFGGNGNLCPSVFANTTTSLTWKDSLGTKFWEIQLRDLSGTRFKKMEVFKVQEDHVHRPLNRKNIWLKPMPTAEEFYVLTLTPRSQWRWSWYQSWTLSMTRRRCDSNKISWSEEITSRTNGTINRRNWAPDYPYGTVEQDLNFTGDAFRCHATV